MFQPLNAKVEPPNYNFSVETLTDFFPQKPIAALAQKHGAPEKMNSENGLLTWKYNVAHVRYRFPVIIQEREGTIEDSFARLPSYFLHDIFLQSLVNKFGKQTNYKKVREEAFYEWRLPPFKYIYSAACTITCFPIFFSAQKAENTDLTIIEKMQKANRR